MNIAFYIVFILALSIIIQAAAATMAFRLINITGRRLAWILIAVALMLMAVRRLLPLYRLIMGDVSFPPDPLNEVIGLTLSIVMAIGIARIAPIFIERNEADDRLRDSEVRYRVLFEGVPDALLLADLETGMICDANQSASRLFARSGAELVGMHQSDLHPGRLTLQSKISFQKHANEAAEGRLSGPFEHVILCADGSEIPVEIVTQPIMLHGKNMILGVFRDISERKRMEETLRRSDEAVYMRERMLNESQRVGQVGGWDWDAVNDVIWWSDEYYCIFGLEPGTPPPNYLDHLQVYTPESAERLDSAVKRAMELGESYELDLELATPTLTTHWVMARSEVKRDTNGAIVGLRGTAHNITERKQAEEEIRRNSAQQKALLEVYQERSDAGIPEIISFVIDKCVNLTGSAIGFVGLISDDDMHMEAHIWSETTMESCPLDKPHNFPLNEAGLWAEPVRQGKIIIINDYCEPNPLQKGYPEGHLELVRFMGIPVVDNDRVVAVAGVSNKREHYAESDQYKVSLLLKEMWEIIKRKRAEDELRALNEQLEQRVQERTAELEAKNAELQKMNRIFVGRELRMVELKERIKELEGGR